MSKATKEAAPESLSLTKRSVGVSLEENQEFLSAASMVISAAATDPSQRVMALASLWPGEGTTTVTLGVAQALVRLYGRTVAVVELNARRPCFAEKFRLDGSATLEALLTGESSPATVREVRPGLALIPSGPHPFGAASSGFSIAFDRVVTELLECYNFILLDGPPLMESADVLVVGPSASSLLLVAASGRVTAKQIAQVKERLLQSRMDLRGVILNKEKSILPRWLLRITGQ